MNMYIDVNPVRFNRQLFLDMIKKIDSCPCWEGCPGDCGEVHCILCRHNVLSTEELMEMNWSKLNGEE